MGKGPRTTTRSSRTPSSRRNQAHRHLHDPIRADLDRARSVPGDGAQRRIKLIGIYRTAFLAPFIASVAAQGVLFSFIFDERFEVGERAALDNLGLPRQGFLGDPDQALFVIVLIGIEGGIGPRW